jgi:hypothetical protein
MDWMDWMGEEKLDEEGREIGEMVKTAEVEKEDDGDGLRWHGPCQVS